MPEFFSGGMLSFKMYCMIDEAINGFFFTVLAASGVMGGSLSHEFHFPAKVGEAQILTCSSCGYAANVEACITDRCDNCGSTSVTCSTGIEVNPEPLYCCKVIHKLFINSYFSINHKDIQKPANILSCIISSSTCL